MGREAGGECAETVVEHQHPAIHANALFVEVREQVFVRRIEGLQRVFALFGVADQVELGEGAGEDGHGTLERSRAGNSWSWKSQ